ncbi:MAG TPA: T9SS type A sorting domain-containing protein [Bacteroidia bacterium]|nr:T9SS type A sorting domain-containing protein [Bacteroidia bacterium]
MKRFTLAFSLLFFITEIIFAQTSFDYTVPITVQTQESVPQITLSWALHAGATNYSVGRKALTSTSWSTLAAGLPGTTISFTDTTVVVGTGYEYRVIRTGSPANGISYAYAGIKVPATEYRGKLILLVDDYFSDTLAAEILQLEKELIGDGWVVIRHDVARTDSVPVIKSIIVSDYNSDPANVKALFLLGHVPVPYSGNIRPDGHLDHEGAWPADVYYADMNGTWTDATVNNTAAFRPQNDNIPGDGKFDQSLIPSDVELQTGRVDFAKLPAFALTETELMRNYLNRAHDYKMKIFDPPKRCLVDDNFGAFSGEAFASNGWRIASILTPDSISAQDYFTELGSNTYQWSYGCGGGSYTSCNGVGNTSDFAADTVQTVFSMLFGSYFGDWDSQNNFLRAPLASGALTSAWAGRPHWHFHPMSLGEPIGFSARLSQNNSSTYSGNNSTRYVHIALMGDPSLRQHIIAPPLNLTGANVSTNYVELHWSPSPDSVLGYYVFKLDTSTGIYNRISPAIVSDTNFAEANITLGINYYMVRAIRLEASVTGTYYNMSEGIFDTISVIINSVSQIISEKNILVYPNPAREICAVVSSDIIHTIQLYDATSRLIRSSAVNAKEYVLDLSGFNTGIYMMKIDETVKKLVVTR